MTIKRLFLILAIAASYIAMAKIGLWFALNPGFATAFFPSSGLAVAALILFGNNVWPGIFLGSLVVNLIITDPVISTSILISTGIGIGSTLQALTAAYLLKRLTRVNHLLSTHRNVFIFLFTTILSCLIASTIGIVVLYSGDMINQNALFQNWITWWLGDIMGILIFVPVILSWYKISDFKDIFKEGFEAIDLFLLIIVISIVCFSSSLKNDYPIAFLLIPCLLWAAFRFKSHITTLLLVLVSALAVWGTSYGYGPFVLPSLNESLMLLQTSIGVISIMTLILISVVNEINHNNNMLEEFNQKLVEQMENHKSVIQLKALELEDKTFALQSRTIELQDKSNKLQEQNRLLEKLIGKHELLNINELINQCIETIYSNKKYKDRDLDLTLNISCDSTITEIKIIKLDIIRSVLNIMKNAFESMIVKKDKLGNEYIPVLSIRTVNYVDRIAIIIRDNGEGMPSEKIKNFFDPLLRSTVTEKFGLRLSMTYDYIVHKHKGEIKIDSEEGQFTEVHLILPYN